MAEKESGNNPFNQLIASIRRAIYAFLAFLKGLFSPQTQRTKPIRVSEGRIDKIESSKIPAEKPSTLQNTIMSRDELDRLEAYIKKAQQKINHAINEYSENHSLNGKIQSLIDTLSDSPENPDDMSSPVYFIDGKYIYPPTWQEAYTRATGGERDQRCITAMENAFGKSTKNSQQAKNLLGEHYPLFNDLYYWVRGTRQLMKFITTIKEISNASYLREEDTLKIQMNNRFIQAVKGEIREPENALKKNQQFTTFLDSSTLWDDWPDDDLTTTPQNKATILPKQ